MGKLDYPKRVGLYKPAPGAAIAKPAAKPVPVVHAAPVVHKPVVHSKPGSSQTAQAAGKRGQYQDAEQRKAYRRDWTARKRAAAKGST